MEDNLIGFLSGEQGLNGELTAEQGLSGNVSIGVKEIGGTNNYNNLTNKPKINFVELIGNKTTSDLGLFDGNYNSLSNQPIIPTKTSQIQNDSGFITNSDYYTKSQSDILLNAKVDKTTTINSKSLNSNVTLEAIDVGALPINTYIPTALSDLSEDSTHRIVTDLEKANWNNKQSALVSGTNIKTINNQSLLGSGNIAIQGGGGGTTDHAQLENLSFANSGHTGFASIADIPTALADLTDDSTHRLVTDTEKTEIAQNTLNRHTHTNKTILDNTTASYLTAEKIKLEGIEANANNYILPSDVVKDSNYVHTDNNYTTSEKSNVALNTTARHSHSNKAILDATTASFLVAEKSKLASLENYDDSGIMADLASGLESKANQNLVPTQASTTNQLADKAFVNSTVSNLASFFITPVANPIGTEAQWASLTELRNASVYYSEGVQRTPTKNNYAIYIETDNSVWRASFDGVIWQSQYKVNDTPFTQAQLDALNSGIASNNVSDFLAHIANTGIHITASERTSWNGKYTKPTAGIPIADLSSGVQTSLGKADSALQSYTETDPTVPSWAKQPNKPTYTANEVGADASGTATSAVSTHNSNSSAHSTLFDNKVDKVTGKGLSANDLTNDLVTAINANTVARHTHSNKSVLDATTASYLTAEKTKLAGIEAEANNYVLPTATQTVKGGIKIWEVGDVLYISTED